MRLPGSKIGLWGEPPSAALRLGTELTGDVALEAGDFGGIGGVSAGFCDVIQGCLGVVLSPESAGQVQTDIPL